MKRDFLLKINVSNILLRIITENQDSFILKIGSVFKDPVDVVETVSNLITVKDFDLSFVSVNQLFENETEMKLVGLPRITVKKNYSMNKKTACVNTDSNGFKLQHKEYQEFINNYYLLVSLEGLTIQLPYSTFTLLGYMKNLVSFVQELTSQQSNTQTVSNRLKEDNIVCNTFKQRIMITLINFQLSIQDNPIASMIFKMSLIQNTLPINKKDTHQAENKELLKMLIEKEASPISLLKVTIKELSIQLTPPFNSNNTSKSEFDTRKTVEDYVRKIGNVYIHSRAFNRYSGMGFAVYLFGVDLGIRDIPARLLRLKFLSLEGRFIKAGFNEAICDPDLLKLFSSSRFFYNLDLFVDDMRLCTGINLINHYKSVFHYIQKIIKDFDDSKLEKAPFENPNAYLRTKTEKSKEQTRAEMRKKSNSPKRDEHLQERAVRWWDKFRVMLEGKVQIKVKKLAVDVLTHTSPVNEECLRLSMEVFFVDLSKRKIIIYVQEVFIARLVELSSLKGNPGETIGLRDDQTAILKVPSIEMVFEYNFNPRDAKDDPYFILKPLQVADKHIQYPEQSFTTTEITLSVSVNIPNNDRSEKEDLYFPEGNVKKIIELSPVPILHYQTSLFAELISLPQMSYDFLSLNGIRPVSLKNLDQSQVNPNSDKTGKKDGESKSLSNLNFSKNQTPNHKNLKENISKNMIEGITQFFKNTELTEEFSNYLDLMAFTLNEQINSISKENLFRKIKEIDVRVNATNVRLLMTNIEKTKDIVIQKRPDDIKSYKLIGIQAVMKGMNFKSVFYKKETQIHKFVFENLFKEKSGKLLRWASKQGEGEMSLIYASFFDGNNLLSLRPLSFEKERLDNLDRSKENEEVFKKFFKINLPVNSSKEKTCDFEINHLFDIGKAINFCPKFMKELPKKPSTPMRTDEKFNFKSKDSPVLLRHFSTAKTNKSQFTELQVNQDFDFSSVGGFFKAHNATYTQQVNKEVNQLTEEDTIISINSDFSNFITIKGCKLLIGQNLSQMGSLLVNDPIETLRKKLATRYLKTKKTFGNIDKNKEGLKSKSAIALLARGPNYLKVEERAVYELGLEIESPQVSIFKEELGSQILFTSATGFIICIRDHYLPFDLYLQDPKKIISLNCNELGIFSAPPLVDFNKKVFWVDDRTLNTPQNTKHGYFQDEINLNGR